MVSGGRKAGPALTEVIHCLQPGSIIRDALRPVRGEEDVHSLVLGLIPLQTGLGEGGLEINKLDSFPTSRLFKFS